jgi:hypothetical protein
MKIKPIATVAAILTAKNAGTFVLTKLAMTGFNSTPTADWMPAIVVKQSIAPTNMRTKPGTTDDLGRYIEAFSFLLPSQTVSLRLYLRTNFPNSIYFKTESQISVFEGAKLSFCPHKPYIFNLKPLCEG